MLSLFVDQNQIQKKGPRACKYPASYIINFLLKQINAKRILDLTYGEGRFYAYARPDYIVGIDIQKLNWIAKPDKFIQTSLFNIQKMDDDFDVVVVDPPFSKKRMKDRFHYQTSDLKLGFKMIVHACK